MVNSVSTLNFQSPQYPKPLYDLNDPPLHLEWKGVSWNDFKSTMRIAIVGSRKCSPYGRQVIESVVQALSLYNVVIISGLALGADSIAHRAALSAKLPTIAVLPTGVHNIYPASHRGLAVEIVDSGGALASENITNIPSMKYHFIARNRIIAALSDVILVPEAALKSGSLHTVSFGLDIGRTILAVPGSILSPLSEGTNNLIKQGATPITNINDVLQVLDLDSRNLAQKTLTADSSDELTLLTLLQDGPLDGSSLHVASKLPLHVYQQTLTILEIKGRIVALGSDTWGTRY